MSKKRQCEYEHFCVNKSNFISIYSDILALAMHLTL